MKLELPKQEKNNVVTVTITIKENGAEISGDEMKFFQMEEAVKMIGYASAKCVLDAYKENPFYIFSAMQDIQDAFSEGRDMALEDNC